MLDGDCFVATLLTRNPDTGLASSVIPPQAGIQYTGGDLATLDSRLRGNDGWKLRATNCASLIQGGSARRPVRNSQ